MKNYSVVDSSSIAPVPVQEHGWPPGDYCFFQKYSPTKMPLPLAALPVLPAPPFVRERSKTVRGWSSVDDCRSSTANSLRTA
jgi:hypothetical protein